MIQAWRHMVTLVCKLLDDYLFGEKQAFRHTSEIDWAAAQWCSCQWIIQLVHPWSKEENICPRLHLVTSLVSSFRPISSLSETHRLHWFDTYNFCSLRLFAHLRQYYYLLRLWHWINEKLLKRAVYVSDISLKRRWGHHVGVNSRCAVVSLYLVKTFKWMSIQRLLLLIIHSWMRTHCLARSQAQHKRDQAYKSSPICGKYAWPEGVNAPLSRPWFSTRTQLMLYTCEYALKN